MPKNGSFKTVWKKEHKNATESGKWEDSKFKLSMNEKREKVGIVNFAVGLWKNDFFCFVIRNGHSKNPINACNSSQLYL